MLDFNKAKAYYGIGDELNYEDLIPLIQQSQNKKYPRGSHLIEAGNSRKKIFFVTKGLVRGYKYRSDGRDITRSIWAEHNFMVNQDAVFFNRPATLWYEALEDTEVLTTEYETIETFFSQNEHVGRYRSLIFQTVMAAQIERMDTFIFQSPQERYESFIRTHPVLAQRIPKKYIAHILGITPVSLSRIRNRLSVKDAKKPPKWQG